LNKIIHGLIIQVSLIYSSFIISCLNCTQVQKSGHVPILTDDGNRRRRMSSSIREFTDK
jgi:hypothetical protein